MLIFSGLAMSLAAASATPPPATLLIALAPRSAPGKVDVQSVTVTLSFEGLAADKTGPLLQMPLVSSNVDSVATVLSGLEARDARGVFKLLPRDVELPVQAARDAEIGGPTRQWFADRPVSGGLTVRYSVPAQASLPPRGPAPPFAFSNDGGGTSAAGNIFLMLPPGDTSWRTQVRWDLSDLPRGARGISSYGTGNVAAPEPLKAPQLRMAFYMAGKVSAWPYSAPKSGFFSAWQGQPPFDALAVMGWTSKLYGHYARFFGQQEPPPYGVFLRYNPVNAGGGVGLYHSFVTTFGQPGGQGSDVAQVQMTLAHEMFHTFSPFIEQPAGLESSWFGEGLATFYQRRLPLRYGLIGPEQFVEDLNFHAGRYYTSPLGEVPNSEVPGRFWADTRIRTLPYDRGMLYFADLDDRVRKKSGGERSLDDLVLAMLAAAKYKKLGNADWEMLLEAELGHGAVEEFYAFLNGRAPLPASDAFGACFRRISKSLRRYDLGFDTAVLAEPRRVVRGLRAGSAAAQAGLRDGDEIVRPVPQDQLQGDQTMMLTLRIRRDGQESDLTYLPRGEAVSAWQWEILPASKRKACAL